MMDWMDEIIEIEVYNQNGELMGGCPILSKDIIDPTWQDTLNALGEFSFKVLANHSHAEYLKDIKNHVSIYIYRETSSPRHVYDGQITSYSMSISENIPLLEVRGLQLAAELTYPICHTNFLREEYPYVAPAFVLNNFSEQYPERAWELSKIGSGTTIYSVGQLKTDHKISHFEFLVDIADYTLSCFVPTIDRQIIWYSDLLNMPKSEKYAAVIDDYDALEFPKDLLPIKSLSLEQSADTVVSGVYAFGNSDYPNWLDVNWDPGSPWRVRNLWGGVVLENLDTQDAYGLRHIYKVFDKASRQESLQRLAQNFLLQNAKPQKVYSMEVAPGYRINTASNRLLYPGQSIYVSYDGGDDNGKYLDIHEDLVILSATYGIDTQTQAHTLSLELTDNITRHFGNGDIVQMLTSKITGAHAVG